MRRIKIIIALALLCALILWSCTRDKRGELLTISPSSMPHEGSTHQKTWIAFNANQTLTQDIILIIATIAQYEPVSILTRNTDHKELLKLIGNVNTHHYPIEVIGSDMHTLWMRDEGPTFVSDVKGHKSGINFNFTKVEQEKVSEEERKGALSSQMSDFIISKANAKIIHSNLKLHNGCFEVDGAGTAIMTESCIINDDYNPYWNKEEIETELKSLLGLKKIIWIEGKEGAEVANTHTDFYVRFVKEGVVLVHRNNDKESEAYERTRENIKLLQSATDSKGNALKVVIVDAPKSANHTDQSYLGYYLFNHALLMQSFGDDEADYKAKKILELSFPDRIIEEVQVDALSSAGGTIHRVTQQEPTL